MDKEAIYEIVEKAKKYDKLLFIKTMKEIQCSFCGKSQSAVQKIISGPGVNICDECVALCNDILDKAKIDHKTLQNCK